MQHSHGTYGPPHTLQARGDSPFVITVCHKTPNAAHGSTDGASLGKGKPNVTTRRPFAPHGSSTAICVVLLCGIATYPELPVAHRTGRKLTRKTLSTIGYQRREQDTNRSTRKDYPKRARQRPPSRKSHYAHCNDHGAQSQGHHTAKTPKPSVRPLKHHAFGKQDRDERIKRPRNGRATRHVSVVIHRSCP